MRKLGFQNTGRYRIMGQNRLPASPAVIPISDATRAERRVPCEPRRRLPSEITAPLEAQLRPKKEGGLAVIRTELRSMSDIGAYSITLHLKRIKGR